MASVSKHVVAAPSLSLPRLRGRGLYFCGGSIGTPSPNSGGGQGRGLTPAPHSIRTFFEKS